jgi:tight adherence protein B
VRARLRWPSRSRDPDLAQLARAVQRLAVLLGAGVPPSASWGYLREGAVVQRIAHGVAAGARVPEAILAAASDLPAVERGAWRGLAAAWAVASEAGAPLAPTLREFAASLRGLAQAQRQVAVALAAPRATARLVLALPAVGLVFGMLLGFDTLGTLATTPAGWGCLVIGGALFAGGAAWTRALVKSARPTDLTPGLECDLMAIAVTGGNSLDRARRAATSAARTCGLALAADGDAAIDSVLDLSRRAGVPAAELLRSEADERRRIAAASAEQRVEALAVRLMLPLGVCVLPAFLVLGVVPLFLSLLGSTLGGL